MMPRMRTTLTLDSDLSVKARRLAARQQKPFKEVINAALRVGLESLSRPSITKPYRTEPRPLGLRKGLSYDNIAELLAQEEGEEHR